MTIKLSELKEEDILNQPIWEHWYENKIEWIRPSLKKEISGDDNTGHIVQTEFILNNGTRFIGFCSPQDTSGLDYIQPVILKENLQINFYKDNPWTQEEKINELKKLNFEYLKVFPLTYKSKVKIDDKYYEGTMVDFNKDK